jgi:hypothetical protein
MCASASLESISLPQSLLIFIIFYYTLIASFLDSRFPLRCSRRTVCHRCCQWAIQVRLLICTLLAAGTPGHPQQTKTSSITAYQATTFFTELLISDIPGLILKPCPPWFEPQHQCLWHLLTCASIKKYKSAWFYFNALVVALADCSLQGIPWYQIMSTSRSQLQKLPWCGCCPHLCMNINSLVLPVIMHVSCLPTYAIAWFQCSVLCRLQPNRALPRPDFFSTITS